MDYPFVLIYVFYVTPFLLFLYFIDFVKYNAIIG